MSDQTDKPVRGLAETGQAQIEERAMALARDAGRDSMNEYDLARAREEILGKLEADPIKPADDEEVPGSETPDGPIPS